MPPLPPPGLPAPGARIGRFLLLEQIGQGGMGIVFRALEENLNREVALKVIAPNYAYDPEFRERFTSEAQSQASLESAHVVAVYAHGEEDGYLYLASQLVPDGDLGQLINRVGVPPMTDALDIIEQTATGLYDAHSAGLVHRDIKPGNVLVRMRGGTVRAYLCDFGIARRINAEATRFSRSGIGTPNYMAPELHSGAQASVATDIYSLGCVLWAALTGMPPYPGDSDYQVVDAHIHQPPPQLPGDDAMVQATNRILRISMAKDPAARYSSASAMRDDLQAALRMPLPRALAGTGVRRPGSPVVDGAPTGHAPRPATRTPGRSRGRSRKRLWWSLAGVGAVLAVAAGASAALLTRSDGSHAPTFLDQDPRDIVLAADKEMSVLDAARVIGDFSDKSTGKIHFDLYATGDGDCKGTITQSDGGVAQILAAGNGFYVKPNAKFIDSKSASSAARLMRAINGRWVLMNSIHASFDEICDLDKLLERDGRDHADDTDRGVSQVDGEDAVAVREDDTKSSHWDVVHVRLASPHYIVRIDGDEGDSYTFSEFNNHEPIEAPAKGEVFDLDAILHAAKQGH